jgi:FMN phosphatase YigB (HAD superfamily)
VIETLVVDLGGVAARFYPKRRLEALSSLSGMKATVIQSLLFDSGLEAQAELGAYTESHIVTEIHTRLGTVVPMDDLLDAWSRAFELDQAVLAYISRIPIPGIIFTNNGPMLSLCLAREPLVALSTVFSQVICSWHVGARKPDEQAFRGVAECLGVAPERLLLLDDSAVNVESARSCGWNAECVSGIDELVAAMRRYNVTGT